MVQASKGGKQSTIIGYEANKPQKQHAWPDNIKGTVVAYIAGNQQLSNWTWDPLNKRERMTGPGNLPTWLGLAKSENTQPTTSLSQHNP